MSSLGTNLSVPKSGFETQHFQPFYTVKVVEVQFKLILRRSYFILWITISVFVTIQYNLMVGAYFSPIGYDQKVSLLLARIAISIADVKKGL